MHFSMHCRRLLNPTHYMLLSPRKRDPYPSDRGSWIRFRGDVGPDLGKESLLHMCSLDRSTSTGKMRRAAAALLALLILSGCSREEATARLKGDLPLDTIDIIHARFPCRSPDLHFFGYRFRISIKGEFSEGEICWNFSSGQWSWRILPGQPLSRLNPRD
jgi:hypothetical protein